jgi:hypothetical protein
VKRAVWVVVGILAAITLPRSVLADTCPPGTQKVGVRRTQVGNTIIVQDICRPLIDIELDEVGKRLAKTRSLISALPGKASQLEADIREWVVIGDTARADAHVAALEMTTTLGLHYLTTKITKARELTADQRKRLLGVFPSVAGSPLQRWRAELIQRLQTARTDLEVLSIIQWASSLSDIAATVGEATLDKNDLAKWGIAVATALQPFVRDPFFTMLLADAKLAEPVLYGWVAAWKMRGRLIDLADLGERHYVEARELTRLYIKDLDRRHQLLAQGAKPMTP